MWFVSYRTKVKTTIMAEAQRDDINLIELVAINGGPVSRLERNELPHLIEAAVEDLKDKSVDISLMGDARDTKIKLLLRVLDYEQFIARFYGALPQQLLLSPSGLCAVAAHPLTQEDLLEGQSTLPGDLLSEADATKVAAARKEVATIRSAYGQIPLSLSGLCTVAAASECEQHQLLTPGMKLPDSLSEDDRAKIRDVAEETQKEEAQRKEAKEIQDAVEQQCQHGEEKLASASKTKSLSQKMSLFDEAIGHFKQATQRDSTHQRAADKLRLARTQREEAQNEQATQSKAEAAAQEQLEQFEKLQQPVTVTITKDDFKRGKLGLEMLPVRIVSSCPPHHASTAVLLACLFHNADSLDSNRCCHLTGWPRLQSIYSGASLKGQRFCCAVGPCSETCAYAFWLPGAAALMQVVQANDGELVKQNESRIDTGWTLTEMQCVASLSCCAFPGRGSLPMLSFALPQVLERRKFRRRADRGSEASRPIPRGPKRRGP